MDENALQDWLNGKETAFACVLVARAALRVVPIMEFALHEDEEERRRMVILPSFRALAAANFSGALLGRAGEVRNVARRAGQEVQTAIDNLVKEASMNEIHVREAVPEIHEEVLRYERDAHDLRVAGDAVDAVMEATQSVVAESYLDCRSTEHIELKQKDKFLVTKWSIVDNASEKAVAQPVHGLGLGGH